MKILKVIYINRNGRHEFDAYCPKHGEEGYLVLSDLKTPKGYVSCMAIWLDDPELRLQKVSSLRNISVLAEETYLPPRVKEAIQKQSPT